MSKFKLNIKGDYYKIYIDDYLHLAIKKTELIGIQTYAKDGIIYPFQIEFYTRSGPILLEYDNVNKWKKMLKLVDKFFLET